MKIKHKGTPVFVLLAKKDGKFIAFHRNTYDEVKDFAKRFECEPAGHIMHFHSTKGYRGGRRLQPPESMLHRRGGGGGPGNKDGRRTRSFST